MHRELFGQALDRNRFEKLLGALVRSGLLYEREDAFEKDGRVIQFRRVYLTPDRVGRRLPEILAKRSAWKSTRRSRRRRRQRSRRPEGDAAPPGTSNGSRPRSSSKPRSRSIARAGRVTCEDWRLAEARKRPRSRVLYPVQSHLAGNRGASAPARRGRSAVRQGSRACGRAEARTGDPRDRRTGGRHFIDHERTGVRPNERRHCWKPSRRRRATPSREASSGFTAWARTATTSSRSSPTSGAEG